MSAGRGPDPTELVRMQGIRRRFGGLLALDGAALALRGGEVHALLGENGAGKTTLLGVLAGLLRPDAGTVHVDGRAVSLRSPRDAWALGIGMVHQHFALVPAFSALENLALGSHRGSALPLDRVRSRVLALMEETGLRVELSASTEALGVGDRQRLEILRTLSRNPRVLVLDEPTAVLAPPEVEGLLKLLRRLAREGMAVALVAHKLDEVLSVADRVTVLREGRVALQAPRHEVDLPILVRAMVGGEAGEEAAEIRTVQPGMVRPERPLRADTPGEEDRGAGLPHADPALAGGEVVARLEGVELAGEGGRLLLSGIDLVVRRGEVVGIAGVEGNGQRELALLLAGRIAAHAGRVDLPAATGFVPEDRTREGLIAGFTLTENLALALHEDPRYRAGPFLRWGRLRERARALMAAYAVKAPGTGTRVAQLSGGNQQRWVVARELSGEPSLLVAENPTRGLDVSAAAFVHRQLRGSAGVVLISTDLDEVLRLSDRVLVMLRGRLIPVPPAERSRSTVGRMMLAGGVPGAATVTEPADGSAR